MPANDTPPQRSDHEMDYSALEFSEDGNKEVLYNLEEYKRTGSLPVQFRT